MTAKTFALLFAFSTLALNLAPARAQATTTWWRCEARIINRDYTCRGDSDHTSDIKFTFAGAADQAVHNCERDHYEDNCGYFNCVHCEWSMIFKTWNDGCPFGNAPFSSLENKKINGALAVLKTN